jgi:site-specific DNA recombinase
MFAIAEELTGNGIACPSAHDRVRNPHRDGRAWSKSAVRVILTNPRYTGHQVWNKQRTDDVLLDVNDVALGHTAVMRWNGREQWVTSKEPVHEPLIEPADFEQVQQMLATRARTSTAPKRAHRSPHPYVFKSLVHCGVCDRKMQGQHSHGTAYYRCRFPQEYALANRIEHPRNVILREDILIKPLDTWLAQEFGPCNASGPSPESSSRPGPVCRSPPRSCRTDRRWPTVMPNSIATAPLWTRERTLPSWPSGSRKPRPSASELRLGSKRRLHHRLPRA